jgi:squalene-hopene/tetraprenyl-beta-curcumene cyclase
MTIVLALLLLQPKVDPAKVDLAVKAGVRYVRAQAEKKSGRTPEAGELILLTLWHAGVRKGDALFDALLKSALEGELQTTYRTALQAMALEAIDRVAYQKRIFQCAQFLVDNQCPNGQWSYGSSTYYPEPEPDYETGKLRVKKQRDGKDHGDHSNGQFAALGLRACHDAGIVFPPEVLRKAVIAWRESSSEGGWNYGPKGNPPYGSMTVGGVAALAIYDRLLGLDATKDTDLAGGLAWLRNHYSVIQNPGRNHQHHLYYLWGLERACGATGTDVIGKADWYAEGATHLLATQAADGSWKKSPLDTCYAILFLKRATRPLVEKK